MSRRIRSIKPDVWDDEALGECSTSARLLFVGLITQADDDGRLPGNPRWIASKVYPYDDDITSADIKGWLAELDGVDVVRLYEAAGKTYISLPAWDSHQTIDKRYYKPSRLPAPPLERSTGARGGLDGDPGDAGTDADERSTPDRIGEDRRGEDGIRRGVRGWRRGLDAIDFPLRFGARVCSRDHCGLRDARRPDRS